MPIARFLPHLLLSAFLLALLGGCGVVSTAPPPTESFYRLPPPKQVDALSQPLFKGGLLVASLSADPLHQDRAMIFATDPQGLRLQSYNYHQWVDTLPNLVREYMVGYLQQAGVADWVTGSERTLNGDYEIQGRLQRFEQLGLDDSAQLVVQIRLWLKHKAAKQPLLRKVYSAKVAMAGAGPPPMVAAGQAALGQIMQTFLADVDALEKR